jgi:hypothetical protein
MAVLTRPVRRDDVSRVSSQRLVALFGARIRAAGAARRAAFYVIECTCDDESLHRRRIDGRVRGIAGWYELDWADVKRTRDSYEPLTCAKLAVDAGASLDENLQQVRAHLGIDKDPTTPTGRTT